MRVIKFRGKDKKTGKWVYGDLTHTKGITPPGSEKMTYPRVMVAGYEVHDMSVGQFTGMLDKKGNEVFEGDIIRCGKKYRYSWEKQDRWWYKTRPVKWNDKEAAFGLDDSHDVRSDLLTYFREICNIFEVVGNVFDNKELLKIE